MSAAEGQNGSGTGTECPDLAALRASVRCGRSQPVVRHLAESGEAFVRRRPMREVIALCGAQVTAPHPDDDDGEDLDCPGCQDCVRYCPDCVHEASRWSAESGVSGDDSGHPGWCSPRHCYLTEEGERVHQSAPTRWEDCEVRFEITLVSPEDDYLTYVELRLASLIFAGSCFYAAMPVPAARRLRDQLSAHLDAERHQVDRNGVVGRVLMSSGLHASAAPESSSTTETGAL
ncbi:MAG: hypothetical protein ACT4NY_21805 [Pseudonocardiales bacterium]